jgi:hypothetical protein
MRLNGNFVQKYQEYLDRQKLDPGKEGSKPSLNSFKSSDPESLVGRMLYQAKVISQIITYIWLHYEPNDPEYEKAKELSKYFTQQNLKGKGLADLMGAEFNDSTPEGKLLKAVFPDLPNPDLDRYYVFPIFDPREIEDNFISFRIDPTIFSGWITDVEPDHPSTLAAVIAYPPRPELGDVTVTKKAIREVAKG